MKKPIIEDFIRVDFELYDFEYPASDITKKLNIQPRLTWTKGEDLLHKGTGKVMRQAEYGRWVLESDLPVGSEIDDQCKQLLELIRPHKKFIINSILGSAKCLVEIGGYTTDISGKVGFYLPASILKEFSEYNAELDIDIYSEPKE